jgi:hypothetical protein
MKTKSWEAKVCGAVSLKTEPGNSLGKVARPAVMRFHLRMMEHQFHFPLPVHRPLGCTVSVCLLANASRAAN